METNERNVVDASTMTPADVAKGSHVAWTDGRGRRCVGYVVNTFPGYAYVVPVEVEGVDPRDVQCFSGVQIPWRDRVVYHAQAFAQLRDRALRAR